MTEKIKAYFVGGTLAGQVMEIDAPLTSIFIANQLPDNPFPKSEPVKTETYILHTFKKTGGQPVRAYILQDLQFGGITDADLAHIPG